MLPVIDLEPFLNGDADSRERTARTIGTACESTGFFYLRGHGVPDSVIAAALAASRAYFALPEDLKRTALRERGHYRGYIPLMPFSEDEVSKRPYLYEAFISGAEVAPDDPACVATGGLYWPNRWPSAPEGFQIAVLDYWHALTALTSRLLAAFALALDQPEDIFTARFDKPLTNMSLLHYPARPGDDGQASARAHFDTDVVTVLLPGEVGGLEVRHRNDGWMEVAPLPGCFVVNIGNMLELWSGGRFRSTMHRVHPPPGRERYSIAYFSHPSYDTVIRPLPGLAGAPVEGKPAEIHAGQDLARFVRQFDVG